MAFGRTRAAGGAGNVGDMELLQQAPAPVLIVLALIDATSLGTLVVPIWLLLRRDYRAVVPKTLLYLAVIAGFYWLVGVLLRAGWRLGGADAVAGLLEHSWVRWLQLLLGAGLLFWAVSTPGKGRQRSPRGTAAVVPGREAPAAAQPGAADAPGGALLMPQRLGRRLNAALDSTAGVVVLALVAGLLELPTMLPYLAALGLMDSLGWATALQLPVLAGYCAVMVLPALALVALRRLAGHRMDRWLGRIGARLSAYTAETLAWVAGVAGFLLVRSALSHLDLGALNPFGA